MQKKVYESKNLVIGGNRIGKTAGSFIEMLRIISPNITSDEIDELIRETFYPCTCGRKDDD